MSARSTFISFRPLKQRLRPGRQRLQGEIWGGRAVGAEHSASGCPQPAASGALGGDGAEDTAARGGVRSCRPQVPSSSFLDVSGARRARELLGSPRSPGFAGWARRGVAASGCGWSSSPCPQLRGAGLWPRRRHRREPTADASRARGSFPSPGGARGAAGERR